MLQRDELVLACDRAVGVVAVLALAPSDHLARQQARVGLKGGQPESGAVTLIQRFGSAANLNIHLHCLVLDGVYRCDAEGEPVFVEVPAPTDESLQTVLHKIITRLMKLLTRRGVLVEEQGQSYMADDDADSV